MNYSEIKSALTTGVGERQIIEAFVCGQCAEEFERRRHELLPSATLADYQCLEVGISARGLQAWCRRHDCNVLDLDLRRCQAADQGESPVRGPSSAFQAHQLTRLDR